MFCRLVVLVRLLVPVQVIDQRLVSEMTYNVDGDVKPYSLTHSRYYCYYYCCCYYYYYYYKLKLRLQ